MKPESFDEVLRVLGHIYVEATEASTPRPSNHIRHIAKVYKPTGEILPMCLASGGRYIGCQDLIRDSNCKKCRDLNGLETESLTKRSLMIDCVHLLVNFEQDFIGAMHWNYHNPDLEPINPDPDGVLAQSWEDQANQLIQMIERSRPTMAKHSNRFGWPDEVSDAEN